MGKYTRKTHDHFTLVMNDNVVAITEAYLQAWNDYRELCTDPYADLKLYRGRGRGWGVMIEHRPRVPTKEVQHE